ncbi:MAG: bifunctional UDP-N-acetylglucosamine diphosphorylase/glucosamine-1-phosphate N-acetyltransferase GlmU [Rickettsiales bacterium]|jgi:bifunctional UDP-N-acetylglucosamine pyrophosphorylase/glucosamine-1-phosphate N-acetyltransferase|nr:bifunctional UDP-N-acetylglucosamine diphosphorylase/glucosamine-1-phosphate N-acetyltransferase GlmU [Rickettsiales bacterium]
MKKLTAVVLCAGKGLRMSSKKSKILHKLGGLEIINHIVNTLRSIDAEEIVLVASKDNKMELENISAGKNIEMAIQTDLSGTCSATRVGLEVLKNKDSTVLLTCGDVPFIKKETLGKMLDYITNTDNSLVVLGFNTKNMNNRYGKLVLNKKNELEKIIEYKDADSLQRNSTLCNAGIYMAKNSKLLEQFLGLVKNNNAAGEYYLTDIVELMAKNGLKCGYIVADENEVVGINSRKELSLAERIFQDFRREEFMNRGVTLIDPATTFFSYDTEIDNDVTIEPNVMLMTGVRIHSGVTIKSFSYLEGCEIESDVTVGPFARLRPGSILGKNSKVGNFCEIKNSRIGSNSKVSHLSYVGDSDVGENTNVGAGTVTCNYDGYSKFRTKIGENSFIGSNTILIAPVEVGENSLTAAGSVITKNVPANSIAAARAEQKNIPEGMLSYRKKREKQHH